MSFFCLLWIPLFYFFRRSISVNTGSKSGWALLFGSFAVLVLFIFGPFVTPSGFGPSRWLSGFVDIVSLPVLLPIIACVSLIGARAFPATVDISGFALAWLVPLAAFRSVAWSSPVSPILLVIVPLLWAAQAVGVPFFIGRIIRRPRWFITVLSALGIIATPLAATTAWWMFYAHESLLGILLLSASLLPAVASMVLGFRDRGQREINLQDLNHREDLPRSFTEETRSCTDGEK
jgi:hypothetical protein